MNKFVYYKTCRVLLLTLSMAASSAVLSASTAIFTLGSINDQIYGGESVGPYPGVLNSSAIPTFFCLDANKVSYWNTTYTGTVAAPSGEAQDESAFLAAYLLSQGQASSHATFVNQMGGPISFAIWQIMGTLGNQPADPAAAEYVRMAQKAYGNGLITSAFLSNFLVFTPDDATSQRFITATNPTPEPSTWLTVAAGLALVWVGRRRTR